MWVIILSNNMHRLLFTKFLINFLHIYKYAAYIWQCDSAWGYNNVNLGKSLYSKSESRSTVSNCLWPHGLYSPWSSPGQNPGVGRLSLLQGIFPTQGWNPGLPHCRWILYQLSHKGSPRLLEWVAYPFSSDLPNPGIEQASPALQADSLPTELWGKP